MVMIVEQLVEWVSGRGNRSAWRKSAPVPLCPPQIPQTWLEPGPPVANRLRYGTAEFHLPKMSLSLWPRSRLDLHNSDEDEKSFQVSLRRFLPKSIHKLDFSVRVYFNSEFIPIGPLRLRTLRRPRMQDMRILFSSSFSPLFSLKALLLPIHSCLHAV
jgi:hypothetical protein